MRDSEHTATVSCTMQSLDPRHSPTVSWSVDSDDSTILLTVKVPHGTSIELEVNNPPVVQN